MKAKVQKYYGEYGNLPAYVISQFANSYKAVAIFSSQKARKVTDLIVKIFGGG